MGCELLSAGRNEAGAQVKPGSPASRAAFAAGERPGEASRALVLGMNIGGYGSQAVRAALQALDPGQGEAGRALGLRRWQILGLVELLRSTAH